MELMESSMVPQLLCVYRLPQRPQRNHLLLFVVVIIYSQTLMFATGTAAVLVEIFLA